MNDAQIIQDVLSGNTARFATLVERYLPLVRGLCASHVRDPASQDDLIQESFVDSYLSLDRLRDRSRFGPWLSRIARNKCVSWIRRKARAQRVHEEVAREASAETQSDPLSDLARREVEEWARGEIGRLPESTREAMSLHYLEARSIPEIADFLGLREAAVRKRLHYGRQLLGQKFLHQFGEGVESPRETDDLKRRVLAAIPMGTIPWKATGATAAASPLAGLLTAKLAIILAVAVAATAAAVWYGLTAPDSPPQVVGNGAPESTPPAIAGAAGEEGAAPGALAAAPTGELALTLGYRVGSFSPGQVLPVAGARTSPNQAPPEELLPAAGARVRLVPLAFDRRAFDAIMREAGVSEKVSDIFALRFQPARPDAVSWRQLVEDLGISEEELKRESEKLKTLGDGDGRGFEERMERVLAPVRGRPARILRSGDDGRLTLSDLGPGYYEVIVMENGAPDRFQVLVLPGERTERTVYLEDVVSAIRGTVVDEETGEPVSKARLVLSGDVVDRETSQWVDENGRFEFPTRQTRFGPFVLRCEASGYLPKEVEGERQIGVSQDIRIGVDQRATISGYVRTAEGTPAPFVSLMRANIEGSGSRGIATTDASGRYSAPHDGGVLRLYASGTTVKSEEVELELEPDQAVVQDFALPPSATAYFDLRTPDGEVPDHITNSNLDGAQHSVSGGVLDRDGERFMIPYLRPGHYELQFMVKGYESVAMDFEIGEDLRDRQFSIVLTEAALDLLVRVLDSAGFSKPSADVHLMRKLIKRTDQGRVSGMSSTLVATATTDENGECEFEGLAEGTYAVHAVGQKVDVSLPREGALVVRMKPPAADVTSLRLSQDTVRAFDGARDDRPMMVSEDRDAATFVLDAEGGLSERRLTVGENRAYLFKSGYPAAETRVRVSQELLDEKAAVGSNVYDREVEFVFGGHGSVYGTVHVADGAACVDERLRVYPADLWEAARVSWGDYRWRSFGNAFAQGARTDEEGGFRIRFLAPGRYVVALSTNVVSDPVEVLAGDESGPVMVKTAPTFHQ